MKKQSAMMILMLIAVAVPALAQMETATVLGTVRGTTGAVIPGATVTLKNVGTGLTRQAVTSHEAEFTVPNSK